MCFSPQRRAILGHLNYQKWPESVVFSAFWLTNMLRATAACHFWTSELPKWLLQPQFFNILTWKCASRHRRMPFFNIATSKMAPQMWCFAHFDFQMCFAPQPRAILEHRNFKKCYGNVSFLPFSLANVLFATAACHFSPARRTATSAPAALASLLFEHQGARFIEKTQRFATSRMYLLSSDSTRGLISFLLTWHLYSACHLYSAFQLCI